VPCGEGVLNEEKEENRNPDSVSDNSPHFLVGLDAKIHRRKTEVLKA
jgi:hypothetical protein